MNAQDIFSTTVINKLQLHGGNGKSKRRDLDFYPTPKECTLALMNFLDLKPCTIREPASGNGAISKILEGLGHSVISSDISLDGYGSGGIDFLKSDKIRTDAIITNPPFDVSDKFILKSLQEADLVAMLLKSQYWHAKKRYSLFTENPPAFVLPLTWRPDFMGG